MKRLSFLGLIGPVLLAGSLHAASDYLLEIDGIKGESQDENHSETIEIDSFSWGANNSGATAGGGSGKVSFQDLHFTTRLSKASPQLLVACASGQHIPKAKLYMRKAGGGREYYVLTLSEVLVSSVQQSGRVPATATASDSMPVETIALNFASVSVVHTTDDGTVTTGEAVRTPDQPPQ